MVVADLLPDLAPLKTVRGDVAAPAFPPVIERTGRAACFAADEFFSARISNSETRRAYARAVGWFLEFCEREDVELHRVTPGLAGRFLRDRPVSAATKNQTLAGCGSATREILVHDNLDERVQSYMAAAGITEDPLPPLVPGSDGHRSAESERSARGSPVPGRALPPVHHPALQLAARHPQHRRANRHLNGQCRSQHPPVIVRHGRCAGELPRQ